MNYTNETIGAYVRMLADTRRKNIKNSPSDYDRFDTVSYYVSENGSDDNDGLTPEAAWKSLDKANTLDREGKCNLLFERGGTWRGTLKAKAHTRISAYGEGPLPVFMGSPESGADAAKWTSVGGGVWKFYKDMPDCGTVVVNGGEAWAKKLTPAYKDGAFVFDAAKDMTEDMTLVCTADSVLTEAGYPDVANATGVLYLRCDLGNPGEVFESVEFLPAVHGFVAEGSKVTLTNISFKYYGASCITAVPDITDFVMYHNEVQWVGGSVKEYGACEKCGGYKAKRGGCGVEINGAIERNFVDNMYFNQIYDAAISHASETPVKFTNIIYSSNLIENCMYGAKYILRDGDSENKFRVYTLTSNIFMDAGGWGAARDCACARPAFVKTCGCAKNPAEEFLIKGNIFAYSDGELVKIAAADEAYLPKLSRNMYVQKAGALYGSYGVGKAGSAVYDEAGFEAIDGATKEFAAEYYLAI